MLADTSSGLRRFERTFNRSRLIGAGLAFALGPFYPNLGLGHVIALGLALFVEAIVVQIVFPRAREHYERLSWIAFSFDMAIVSYGFLVFSVDPYWTTYLVGALMPIAGGFRFGPRGAYVSAAVMSIAYVAVAQFRAEAFGLPESPQRLAFPVSMFCVSAFLMSGILRELATLRAQREAFVRQTTETAALRAVDQLKSEFLAAMSHDFRSPLTVVRGAVELLLGEKPGKLTIGQRDLAQSAERNVRRLEEFTEELLEMARLEHGAVALDREEVDPTELAREVVSDHQVLAKEKHQWFNLHFDSDNARLLADRSRMRQVMANLVGNAIKYAPTSTPIDVRAERDDGHYRLAVADHGPGISREERERVFDRFYRGARASSVPGAGLGLAIARSLVELHGGTLECQDTPGGGATFVMTVPLE